MICYFCNQPTIRSSPCDSWAACACKYTYEHFSGKTLKDITGYYILAKDMKTAIYGRALDNETHLTSATTGKHIITFSSFYPITNPHIDVLSLFKKFNSLLAFQ